MSSIEQILLCEILCGIKIVPCILLLYAQSKYFHDFIWQWFSLGQKNVCWCLKFVTSIQLLLVSFWAPMHGVLGCGIYPFINSTYFSVLGCKLCQKADSSILFLANNVLLCLFSPPPKEWNNIQKMWKDNVFSLQPFYILRFLVRL